MLLISDKGQKVLRKANALLARDVFVFNPWSPIWWNKMMIFVCFLTVPNEWEVVRMQGTNEKI